MRKIVAIVGTLLCATFALLAAMEAAPRQGVSGTADSPTYSKV